MHIVLFIILAILSCIPAVIFFTLVRVAIEKYKQKQGNYQPVSVPNLNNKRVLNFDNEESVKRYNDDTLGSELPLAIDGSIKYNNENKQRGEALDFHLNNLPIYFKRDDDKEDTSPATPLITGLPIYNPLYASLYTPLYTSLYAPLYTHIDTHSERDTLFSFNVISALNQFYDVGGNVYGQSDDF